MDDNGEKPYTKREMDYHFKNLFDRLDKQDGYLTEIKFQTLKTNGRVNKLENHRQWLWGAIASVVFLSGVLGFLIKFWVEENVKLWAKEAVSTEFDSRFNNIEVVK